MAFTSSYTDGLIQQSEYYYGIPSLEMTGSISLAQPSQVHSKVMVQV